MSRKSAFPYETEKRPFAENLRVLMKENGTTQRELGEAIGVRPQTISLYCVGQSLPDVEGMAKICKYFNVSSDWLIGVTDVRSADITARAACEYTGLTEDAVEKLHSYKDIKKESDEWPDITGILSAFITTETLLSFADHLDESMQTRKSAIETLEDILIKNNDDMRWTIYNLQIGTWQDNQLYRLERFEAIDAATNFVNGQLEHYNKKYADLYEKCMAIISGGEINGEHKERNE